MDITSILQLIPQYGFTVVMCLLLFYRMKEMSKEHTEESKGYAQAIENNTLAIQKLTDIITYSKEEEQ